MEQASESSKPSCSDAGFVLGIDLGTTSVKVCVLDTRDCSVVADITKETEASVESIGSEQDVRKILETLEFCVESLGKIILENVIHIGVCGQMHGVCLWTPYSDELQRRDFQNWKFSNLFTWMDGRCDEAFINSLPIPDSHLKLSTGHGAATLFWLARNTPETIKEYRSAGTIMDLLVAYLCGLSKPVMSIQNAASWGYCNTELEQWNLDILKSANFPVHLLPELRNSSVLTVGDLATPWLGIKAGTTVGLGLGDLQCSIYSTGLNKTEVFVNMSTSAQIGYLTDFEERSRNPSAKIEYFPYFNDSYFAVGASLNGGNVLASFVNLLFDWTTDLDLEISKEQIWTKILAAGSKARNSDLKLVTTPYGERHCPAARASVRNITDRNAGLGSVVRGLCQGLVNNLADFIIPEDLKSRGIKSMTATGSALSRNSILQEELHRKFGLKINLKPADAAHGVALYFVNKGK